MSAIRRGCVLIFLALLAPLSEQTTWAGIGLLPTPLPVQVVLAGPGPCEGYVLSLGADYLWNAQSISPVLYKHPDPQTPAVELVHVTVNPTLRGTNLSGGMPSRAQPGPQSSALIGVQETWKGDGGAGIAAATAGVNARKLGWVLGGGDGAFADANGGENGNDNGNADGDATGNPSNNEFGNDVANENANPNEDANPSEDAGLNPGNSEFGQEIANENGNPGGNGPGNPGNQINNGGGNGFGPAAAAVSAPEPSSILIWLGAGLAGTSGIVYRRFKRRK